MKNKKMKEEKKNIKSNEFHKKMTGIERLLMNRKISKGLVKTYKRLRDEGKLYADELEDEGGKK